MKTPSVSLASLVRQLSALRYPKNAAGVRSSLHFSTAAEIPDSLHLPPAARARNSPKGGGKTRQRPVRAVAAVACPRPAVHSAPSLPRARGRWHPPIPREANDG